MPSRRRGFTLIEVLVTAGLVGLVLGIICTTLLSGARFTATVQRRAEDEMELSRVCEQIRFQLLSLNVSPVRQLCISGMSRGERADEIDFVTADLIRHGGIGDVSYRIEEDAGGRPYLAYREHAFVYPDTSFVDPGPYRPLSRLVSGLTLQYQQAPTDPTQPFNDTNWVASWQQQVPPGRIRVTLYLGPRDDQRPYVLDVQPALVTLTPAGELPGIPRPSRSGSPFPSPGTAVTGPTP